MSVQEIMTRNPVTLKASERATEAARTMRELGIGDVLVVEEDGSLCGLVTDRDLVVRLMAQGLNPADVSIGSICSRDLAVCETTSTLDEAEAIMKERSVRRLPLVEEGRPVGIVSLGDIAAARERHSTLGAISTAPPNK